MEEISTGYPESKSQKCTLALSYSVPCNIKLFGLMLMQLLSSFKGAEDYDIQAWVITPSSFDKSRKYPLALYIHGGPVDAWRDSWSTRWNPLVLAEQGYVVVAPNPTGSVGFGQKLAEGINGEWGGRPYHDLEQCFHYVETHLSFVDTTNAVALGASYGGYMINWIQGNPLAKKLRALVCHDGVFSELDYTFLRRHEVTFGCLPTRKKAAC